MSIRLDKWLWAARFYKTRAIAKKAIEGGKVHFDSQRTKVSKAVNIDDIYQIQQSYIKKTVVVIALEDNRKSAANAQHLYKETSESIILREKEMQIRQASGFQSIEKPTKKDRRKIINFKRAEPI